MARFKFLVLAAGLACIGCASYKSDIMFSPPADGNLPKNFSDAETAFRIRKNDLLEIEVYSNSGETKPNFPSFGDGNSSTNSEKISVNRATFLVDERGIVKFPIIQEIKLEGLNLREAEALLENEYSNAAVTKPFVKLSYANKRVVVLGATGGRVVQLQNQQMKLTEVLALAEGVPENGNASNIRVLRNNDVIIADLSTIAGYRTGNIVIQPNDIIYVEPVKRPFLQGLRDYGPVFSVLTSVAALIVVLVGVN